jgi:hypothetical protein
MASPMVIIPQLEGYCSTLVNSGVTPATAAGINTFMFEPVFEWVNVCKRLMRQPGNRDQTDWALGADGSIVNASSSGLVYTGASTLYATLFGSIDTAHAVVNVLYDHANKTLDFTAALDALARALVYQPAAASAANREYMGVVWEQGIPIATAISWSSDGVDGTAPAANDVSMLNLYRTA